MNRLYILLLFLIIILVGCNKSNETIVRDYVTALNETNISELEKILDTNFVSISKYDTFNRQYILKKPKTKGVHFDIVNIINKDSLVIAQEEMHDIIVDSLDVSPKAVMQITYHMKNKKILSEHIDTILNKQLYLTSYNDKVQAFLFFLKDSFDVTKNEASDKIGTYIQVYKQLSPKQRKQYKLATNLQGTFISNDIGIEKTMVPKLVFKGKSTVICTDAFSLAMGFDMSTTRIYDFDETYLRIYADNNEVSLFEIKDNNTLVGVSRGVKGTYTREN